MFNNLINTVAQNYSNDLWVPLRANNENCLSGPVNQWKYIDYRKVTSNKVHPLALYYKLAILLSNCLNCLDHNKVAVDFNITQGSFIYENFSQ